MKPVIIKRINLDHVFAHDRILFNTNNHPFSETEKRPTDYKEKIELGNTKNWIDKFPSAEEHQPRNDGKCGNTNENEDVQRFAADPSKQGGDS